MTQDKIEITKEQFAAFRAVQESGETNMCDTQAVSALSDTVGDTWISPEQVREIMHSYEALLEKFEGVKS